jgi:glycosyltransferase involved in cell wall biosynthesis
MDKDTNTMRICIFSERQAPASDEGIRNYALALARALEEASPEPAHSVRLLTVFGESQPGGGRVPSAGVTNLPGNPLLLSAPLRREIRRWAPHLLLYVPTACATPFSLLRSWVLKRYAKGAPVVQIDLQPRTYGRLSGRAMRVLWRAGLRPDLILVQSEATRATLELLGCALRLIRPGIDLERFRPLPAAERAALRARHGISPKTRVLLHVGHLNRARGLRALIPLQGVAGQQVVVVGSSSTQQDEALVAELCAAGVWVIDTFVPDIAVWYQLADCYLFPVQSALASIDVPLSVLEAMACDLPVVCTRLPGLTRLFAPSAGLRFVDDASDLPAAVADCRLGGDAGTRRLVEPYAWPQVAREVLQVIAEALSGGTA